MKGIGTRNDKKHLAVKYIIQELNEVYDEVSDEIKKDYLKGALDILEEEVVHEQQ